MYLHNEYITMEGKTFLNQFKFQILISYHDNTKHVINTFRLQFLEKGYL